VRDEVRILTEHDADEFVRLRLEAVAREPTAFGRAAEEALPWSPESVPMRLRAVPDGDFVVGAFDGARMVGQAGFIRYEGAKRCHKGDIWGMYVTATARGRGIARAMLTRIVERARTYTGLEQISLGVFVTQDAARTLYRSFGFEPYGYEKHAMKIGNAYVDGEQMVLWLKQRPA
jgi:ribosomal protein S18 acetylase RimI-like enzyme